MEVYVYILAACVAVVALAGGLGWFLIRRSNKRFILRERERREAEERQHAEQKRRIQEKLKQFDDV
ncbi:hypothetical protein [Roseibium aggregatum]|uniref:Uncharacterized protein n=1 Tax=Roseibium aggregatum TaxID=187304 RepID=A0A926P3I9_9HYPH|nr:hypothetical protein [Roseibium aggregatum]MBD1549601.1 hypothetical protein [Roseibium aggregatum]